MKYTTAAAFRTALEERLKSQSSASEVPLNTLRKQVAFDRLLARLAQAAPDRWVLKGALALDFRLGGRTRATNDLDLARGDDDEAALEDFLRASELDLGDYFLFAIARSRSFRGELRDRAARYHARADLAGRVFEAFVVDVSFSDPMVESPDRRPGPDLLEFAGIPRTMIPILPLQHHIAEKVHAYTRSYGDGERSSRVKDLVDLVLISEWTTMASAPLREALQTTFSVRDTHPMPPGLPSPPRDWSVPYRSSASALSLDPDLGAGHAAACAFLNPVLADSALGSWNPAKSRWCEHAGGDRQPTAR